MAGGQTGANSGVIHAGIYYAPGLAEGAAVRGRARGRCTSTASARGIRHERCGKVIVARDEGELGRLDELERRGRENQVPGLRRLSAGELREVEPHCRGVAALHSPATGIVDFAEVARALAARARRARARRWSRAAGSERGASAPGASPCSTTRGETRARFAVFCAGVGSDRLAVAAGASPDPRIVPFRGAYLYLRPERRDARALADLPGARSRRCRSSACT